MSRIVTSADPGELKLTSDKEDGWNLELTSLLAPLQGKSKRRTRRKTITETRN